MPSDRELLLKAALRAQALALSLQRLEVQMDRTGVRPPGFAALLMDTRTVSAALGIELAAARARAARSRR